ncbi:hypothetical protein B0H63DRAFT_265274 [Podospora didyma]|uniref:Uncharacterized protein n=1 Tax=Podospora didyma TaxID=330526 RepID=A0AAE0KFK3_9PEZI|nr:hypothetical protein B0H63DRAFT_265274 [Podospora didyma]
MRTTRFGISAMLEKTRSGTGPETASSTEGRFTLHLAEAHIRDSAVEADTGCRQEIRICLPSALWLGGRRDFEAKRLGHTLTQKTRRMKHVGHQRRYDSHLPDTRLSSSLALTTGPFMISFHTSDEITVATQTSATTNQFPLPVRDWIEWHRSFCAFFRSSGQGFRSEEDAHIIVAAGCKKVWERRSRAGRQSRRSGQQTTHESFCWHCFCVQT